MDMNFEDTRECSGMYIVTTLVQIGLNGDNFSYDRELFQQCKQKNPGLTEQEFRRDLAELQHKDLIRRQGQRIYLYRQYVYEDSAAASLANILTDVQLPPVNTLADPLHVGDLTLTDEQRCAVRLALSNRLFLLLGSAGTGKTTLLQALINHRPAGDFVLCAPTGKAARNLTAKTGYQARTVHAAMGVGIDEFFLKPVTWNSVKMVVIDEASMVTLEMLAGILNCVSHDCRVVLVGDPYQLQSVGAGNVIFDLLELGTPSFQLREIHRQAGTSHALTYNVTHFHQLASYNDLRFDPSFEVRPMCMEEIAAAICDEAVRRYRAGESVQVLSPYRKSHPLSTGALNLTIRQQLNPPAYNKLFLETSRGLRLYNGDRVMIRQNDRDHDCSNGDVGILRIYMVNGYEVDYAVQLPDGRCPRWQEIEYVDQLMLAYVLTVHKAQGGESDTVLMPLHPDFSRMLSRNLLYTAITRAKKQVILFGDPGCVDYAMQTTPPPRRSMLVLKTRVAMSWVA